MGNACTNWFARSEGWLPEDATLIGARVVGRCAILRHPVGDQEPSEVRCATGITLELDNGMLVGVFWQRETGTGYFATVPLVKEGGTSA